MKEIDFMPRRRGVARRGRRYGRHGVLLLGTAVLLLLAVHLAGLSTPNGAVATLREAPAIAITARHASAEAPARAVTATRPAATETVERMPTQ